MQTKNVWQKAIASVLGSGTIALVYAPSAPCLDKSEWVFEQRHFNNGTSKIYLSDTAIRINNVSRGFQIIAKAPDWTVEIFRTDRKVCYKTDLDNFSHFTTYGIAGTDAISTVKTEQKLLGTKREGELTLKQYDFGSGKGWLSTDLTNTPQIRRILAIYNQSPKTDGVITSYILPVRKQRTPTIKANTAMAPLSAETLFSTAAINRTKFNSSDFQYPTSYRQVQSYAELLTKRVSADEVNWFMPP